MNSNPVFDQILKELQKNLRILPDKPEESAESTLRALWLKSCDIPVSAELAMKTELPVLNESGRIRLNELIQKRIEGIPLSHLTGRQRFMGIELLSDERALIPRKETEILGKKALELLNLMQSESRQINVMDLCCGAGNLSVALAAKLNGNVKFYASDLSEEAVALTRENINMHKLEKKITAFQGDVFTPFESHTFYERISLILCNPPYISSFKVSAMDDEISKNEPELAFNGGMLGTKIIQKLISETPGYLVKGGWLIFEVGKGQGPFIIDLIKKGNKYSDIDSVSDPDGNIRVVLARK
jgi:release factor glutamine methyltransferase